MYDVIIIGAGPAGISASLNAVRSNLKVLVLYNGESAQEKADLIQNYYGFENGISGRELYENGIKQAINLGVEVKKEEVVNVEIELGEKNIFKVETLNNEYISNSLILATGIKRADINIKNIEKYEGKGISYCAICDGFFYKNKPVAVLGSGNYAISEALHLKNVTDNVKILTNGSHAPEYRAENLDIVEKEIKEVCGNEKIEAIEFTDGSKIQVDGIFVAVGVAGSTDFAKKLGVIIENNKIVVDDNMETNIKGLYACGDCTGGLYQINKSVYEGAKAGLSVIKYKKERNVDNGN